MRQKYSVLQGKLYSKYFLYFLSLREKLSFLVTSDISAHENYLAYCQTLSYFRPGTEGSTEKKSKKK